MKKKILVVDDDEGIRESLEILLTDEGYEVTTANSGEEALKRLDKVAPDVMILDVTMPGISGIQVCKKIRSKKQYKNLPILMLSANSKPEDELKGLRAGADDYVKKPFENVVLLARIEVQFRYLNRLRGGSA